MTLLDGTRKISLIKRFLPELKFDELSEVKRFIDTMRGH